MENHEVRKSIYIIDIHKKIVVFILNFNSFLEALMYFSVIRLYNWHTIITASNFIFNYYDDKQYK